MAIIITADLVMIITIITTTQTLLGYLIILIVICHRTDTSLMAARPKTKVVIKIITKIAKTII